MSIANYKEGLEHFNTIGMLNNKGMKEYIKILKEEIFTLKEKIIDMELKLSYMRKK